MKSVIYYVGFSDQVANIKTKRQQSTEQYLRAQVDIAYLWGWAPSNLIVMTDKTWEYRGVKAINLPLVPGLSVYTYKAWIIPYLWREGLLTEDAWLHDLDAWQVAPFNNPLFGRPEDILITQYSVSSRLSTGSIFLRIPQSVEILDGWVSFIIEQGGFVFDEDAFIEYFQNRGSWSGRWGLIDVSYNLAQAHSSLFIQKYRNCQKPVKVVHFHADWSSRWRAWVKRCLVSDVLVSQDVRRILYKHFWSNR
jgi:hypothetical protein